MRLIDVDDFFERMENDTDLCAEMERDGLKALKKYLDLQPTAYDVDKVVEQLEEEKEQGVAEWNFYRSKNNRNMTDMYAGAINAFTDAIRIVKAGGVDEE